MSFPLTAYWPELIIETNQTAKEATEFRGANSKCQIICWALTSLQNNALHLNKSLAHYISDTVLGTRKQQYVRQTNSLISEGRLRWKSENILAVLSFYSIVYWYHLFFHFNYCLFFYLCYFQGCLSFWKNRTRATLIALCSSLGKWDLLLLVMRFKSPCGFSWVEGRGKESLEAAPSSWTCLDWHSLCKQPWLQSCGKMCLSP